MPHLHNGAKSAAFTRWQTRIDDARTNLEADQQERNQFLAQLVCSDTSDGGQVANAIVSRVAEPGNAEQPAAEEYC